MGNLGVLERLVMDVLWNSGEALGATELRERLTPSAGATPATATAERRSLAMTTVLTVLSRLENKGFVTRDRALRPHAYRAVSTRAEHTAGLMHAVLATVPDREAALARFIGGVTPEEADTLRALLGPPTGPAAHRHPSP